MVKQLLETQMCAMGRKRVSKSLNYGLPSPPLDGGANCSLTPPYRWYWEGIPLLHSPLWAFWRNVLVWAQAGTKRTDSNFNEVLVNFTKSLSLDNLHLIRQELSRSEDPAIDLLSVMKQSIRVGHGNVVHAFIWALWQRHKAPVDRPGIHDPTHQLVGVWGVKGFCTQVESGNFFQSAPHHSLNHLWFLVRNSIELALEEGVEDTRSPSFWWESASYERKLCGKGVQNLDEVGCVMEGCVKGDVILVHKVNFPKEA